MEIMEGARSETKRGGGGRGTEVVMRVVALVLTLTAAIVMGLDKQSKTVTLSNGDPPLSISINAKSSYQTAFVYFVVANTIASTFATLTLLLALVRPQASAHTTVVKVACDMMIVALLFAAIGAAATVGLLGYKGNSHVMWNEVCNQFGRFCHGVLASLVFSFSGSIVFLLLVLLAFHKLRRK